MSARRASFLAAAVLLVPLGFATKLYSGPGSAWVGGYAGGVFYVAFWVFALLALAPRLSPARASAIVFAVTCCLEALQLWKPPILEALRSHFLGHALLGTTFSLWDFPHYAAGAILAWATARSVGAAQLSQPRRLRQPPSK